MATSSFGAPIVPPKFRAFTAAGLPLAGGKLYSYVSGTSTPLSTYPTYADALLGTNANANPVVLDANGEATIFGQATPYKLILQDSAGVVQWTVDADYVGYAAFTVAKSFVSVVKTSDVTGYGSATKVTGWTTEVDTLSEWDGVTNNRWTAQNAGKTTVLLSAEMSDSGTNVAMTLAIRKNGSEVARTVNRSSATASQIWGYHAHYEFNAIVGDYIEVYVTGSAGTTVKGSVGTRLSIQQIP